MWTRRSMLFRILLPAGAVLVGTTIAVISVRFRAEEEEDVHYQRGETEVGVEDLAGQSFVVVKAGSSLVDTMVLGSFDSRGSWLVGGNYFVMSSRGNEVAYYPVPLNGYRSGPDAEGRFTVTIRPFPSEAPPIFGPDTCAFRYVPSGSFLLGDRRNPTEPHLVWLTGFFMAPFEVSNVEFRRFVDASDGYADDQNWTDAGRRQKTGTETPVSAILLPKDPRYRRFGHPDQPVTMVSWHEANAYCHWLTRTVGKGKWQFSLPTDAEWEKAARGPDNFDYGLGMQISDAEIPLYNWKKNPGAEETVIGAPASRARFRPNRYGVYHMTGNVAEWCQSEYRSYGRASPYLDDERNRDDRDGRRSVRGGSWYSATSASLSIPYRDAFQPEHRGDDLGFRLVARRLP